MVNLAKICESERVNTEENKPLYRTFAETFLEEPLAEEQIPGSTKITYFAKVLIPTFCYFRKLPLIDDADWLE